MKTAAFDGSLASKYLMDTWPIMGEADFGFAVSLTQGRPREGADGGSFGLSAVCSNPVLRTPSQMLGWASTWASANQLPSFVSADTGISIACPPRRSLMQHGGCWMLYGCWVDAETDLRAQSLGRPKLLKVVTLEGGSGVVR